jgi:carbamoyltransferase
MKELVKLKNDGTYRLNLDYFRHHNQPIGYEWGNDQPRVSSLYSSKLVTVLGPARTENGPLEDRHLDLARSVQAMYEDAFIHLLNKLQQRYRTENLTLSGGCAMNSVANGKIRSATAFRNIYIQSAAGDAGGAIGAAVVTNRNTGGEGREFCMEHSYWGPGYSNDLLWQVVQREKGRLEKESCRIVHMESESELYGNTATALAAGKVVGWFQGRMEWGPRALGNRSILGDPRRDDMKEIMNHKIKRRESFRPFAPSILRQYVPEWFETEDDVPFMMKVYQVRQERRSQVPAVTHVDGSGRLQTVTRQTNEPYYRLITEFYRKTGVPIVLNTSFNENEPIVCRPEEAIECFLRTRMDMLVLGNISIERPF